MGDRRGCWRWRPEPWWLLMPLLGLVTGGVFGVLVTATLMVDDALAPGGSDLAPGAALAVLGFGSVLGATYGLWCGVPVGLVLMLLVGRDMPGPHAGWLAFVGAAGTHAVALGVVFRGWSPDDSGFLLLLVASALVAGLVAVWFLRRLRHRPAFAGPHPD